MNSSNDKSNHIAAKSQPNRTQRKVKNNKKGLALNAALEKFFKRDIMLPSMKDKIAAPGNNRQKTLRYKTNRQAGWCGRKV